MSPRCDYCDASGELTKVDVTDDSGVGSARLCGRCMIHVDHPRCTLCGTVKLRGAKSGEVFEAGSGESGGEVCDDCRDQLLSNRVVAR